MKLLLTGFEPFGESKINPSEQVARALAHRKIAGVKLHTAILPVDRARGPQRLIDEFTRSQPDAVLCLGQATSRLAISIERVAINLLDFRMADNAGQRVTDQPIARDAPAAYFTTLPARALREAARAAGVPCELSLTAGSYLCNQITYVLLHHLAQRHLNIPAGFVHLPALPEQVIERAELTPSMSLETMIVGVRAMIGVIKNLELK